jgi:hypothetical protein
MSIESKRVEEKKREEKLASYNLEKLISLLALL